MPLPVPDWSSPSTRYSPQALYPGTDDYDQHDRDASLHAHNFPPHISAADQSAALIHLTAHPASRGGPGWVAHRHA